MKTKSAMITIAGRPNVGKSTLTNALVGEKIAIVSNKPQTTRNRICAVVNRENTQLVFIDTPGFHRPRTKLGDYMVNVVKESVADVDAVILLVEPIANVGEQEHALIERIKASGAPAMLVINKIDTVEKEALLPVIAAYQQEFDFDEVIPISAKWRDGVATLLEACEKYAQPGPMLFPEDMVTDMPEKQVMAEIIREKLFEKLYQEVPYSVAVDVEVWDEEDDRVLIHAAIYVAKPSHKAMVIGRAGEGIKAIGTAARKEIRDLVDKKVHLELWVKVREDWVDDPQFLHSLGFGAEAEY